MDYYNIIFLTVDMLLIKGGTLAARESIMSLFVHRKDTLGGQVSLASFGLLVL